MICLAPDFILPWARKGCLFLALGMALPFASPVAAQLGPPRLGPVVLGESSRSVIEGFVGETLSCELTEEADPEWQSPKVEYCTASSPESQRLPEALLVDGMAVSFRYLPKFDGPISDVLDTVSRTLGVTPRMSQGSGTFAGLRYWEFPLGGHQVFVSEVRLRDTGAQRIRISMFLDPSLWMPDAALYENLPGGPGR